LGLWVITVGENRTASLSQAGRPNSSTLEHPATAALTP
jgi:hypothetical protein